MLDDLFGDYVSALDTILCIASVGMLSGVIIGIRCEDASLIRWIVGFWCVLILASLPVLHAIYG